MNRRTAPTLQLNQDTTRQKAVAIPACCASQSRAPHCPLRGAQTTEPASFGGQSLRRFSGAAGGDKLANIGPARGDLFKKFSLFHFQRSPLIRAKFTKQLLRQWECLAPRPLIEAVSDDAITLVVTQGL